MRVKDEKYCTFVQLFAKIDYLNCYFLYNFGIFIVKVLTKIKKYCTIRAYLLK